MERQKIVITYLLRYEFPHLVSQDSKDFTIPNEYLHCAN